MLLILQNCKEGNDRLLMIKWIRHWFQENDLFHQFTGCQILVYSFLNVTQRMAHSYQSNATSLLAYAGVWMKRGMKNLIRVRRCNEEKETAVLPLLKPKVIWTVCCSFKRKWAFEMKRFLSLTFIIYWIPTQQWSVGGAITRADILVKMPAPLIYLAIFPGNWEFRMS